LVGTDARLTSAAEILSPAMQSRARGWQMIGKHGRGGRLYS
jgi:hypothetical protein